MSVTTHPVPYAPIRHIGVIAGISERILPIADLAVPTGDCRALHPQVSFRLAAWRGAVGFMLGETSHPAGRVHLLGPFTVLDAAGRDCTPQGQKTQALLAMLAVAPRGTRSRAWLRDKLWSDRGEQQANGSLRQSLSELRKALRAFPEDVLSAGNHTVSLDVSRLWVDVHELARTATLDGGHTSSDACPSDFLEGIDIKDPEFEEWLSTERSYWLDVRDKLNSRADLRDGGGSSLAAISPANFSGTRVPPHVYPAELGIGILPPIYTLGDRTGERIANAATDLLLHSVHEIDQIDLYDFRHATCQAGANVTHGDQRVGPALMLRTRVSSTGSQHALELAILDAASSRLEWTRSVPAPADAERLADDLHVLTAINYATETIVKLLGSRQLEVRDRPEILARLHVLGAIDDLFDIGRERLIRAETRIRESLALAPASQTYAWLAFAATFKIGQKFAVLTQTELDEIKYLARRALELDANNSLSLTLCAHVFSYVFHDQASAANLFVRALKINPHRPLTWDLFSVLHAYTGMPEAGLKCAEWARQIGFFSPYSYYFDASCCISASLAGRHSEAIEHGHRALSIRPHFNPVLRFMLSSLGHLGDRRAATECLSKLLALEPDFSVGTFLHADHAVMPRAQRDDFIRGLKRAGVAMKPA